MPISKYAKVVLLAPAIGSALIGVFGLLLGIVFISRLGHLSRAANATPQSTLPTLETAVLKPAIAQANSTSNSPAYSKELLLKTTSGIHFRTASVGSSGNKRAGLPGPDPKGVLFQRPISSDQLGFLNDYAGRPANDVVREPGLRNLVDRVVPYAPFHLGLDMPLPRAVESMLWLRHFRWKSAQADM